jgi:uncharacterized protein (TIGR02147 family)
MPNIFNYQDYRQFLGDYYEEKKAMHPSFSYQSFSQKAGFASKSFVFNVIKGKKALSRNSVVKLSIAMNLSRQNQLISRIWCISTNPPISPRGILF